jgi:hypothetical protein
MLINGITPDGQRKLIEYIMAECRKSHFTRWDESELRSCQEVLPNLMREELVKLYRSKWVDDKLRKTVFKVLFADKVGKRHIKAKVHISLSLLLQNLELSLLIRIFAPN